MQSKPVLQGIKTPSLYQLRLNDHGVFEILNVWAIIHQGENSEQFKATHNEQRTVGKWVHYCLAKITTYTLIHFLNIVLNTNQTFSFLSSNLRLK